MIVCKVLLAHQDEGPDEKVQAHLGLDLKALLGRQRGKHGFAEITWLQI